MTEKVILTKRQAKFIEDHRNCGNSDSTIAYRIASVGWGKAPILADGTEESYNSKEGWTFENDEKMKMMTALIDGYEVKKEEKWVLVRPVLVNNDRVNVFYQSTMFIPTDRAKTAMEFETKEKAEEYARNYDDAHYFKAILKEESHLAF